MNTSPLVNRKRWSSKPRLTKPAESLVAFANAQGGTVLLGVSYAGMFGHSSLLTPALNNDRLYKISKIKKNILIIGELGFIGADFILDWLRGSDEPSFNVDKLTCAGNLESVASLHDDSRVSNVHSGTNYRHGYQY